MRKPQRRLWKGMGRQRSKCWGKGWAVIANSCASLKKERDNESIFLSSHPNILLCGMLSLHSAPGGKAVLGWHQVLVEPCVRLSSAHRESACRRFGFS